jgi:hypothetical protein
MVRKETAMNAFNIEALPLQDGQKVTITIHPVGSAVDRLVGSVPWHGSIEDLDYLIMSDDNSTLEES